MRAGEALAAALTLTTALEGVGGINKGTVTSLSQKLKNAQKQAESGHNIPAINMIEAALNELEAIVRSGRATDADVMALRAHARMMTALEWIDTRFPRRERSYVSPSRCGR